MTSSDVRLHAHLIVRDEQDCLPACLDSLAGVVDVVHVHDTGSVDGTVALALAAGAEVSHGGWDGDFARARNEATRQAAKARNGFGPQDWVLAVDADERVVADRGALLALLAGPGLDAVVVDIDNEHDEGPYTHDAVRLYRPLVAAFEGAVHERVTRTDGAPLGAAGAPRDVVRIQHAGYRTAAARRGKGERNARIAKARLDRLPPSASAAERSRVTLDLGRSQLAAGLDLLARETLMGLVRRWPRTAAAIQAREFLARMALGGGHDQEVLSLVSELRTAGVETPGGYRADYADWLEAQALAQLGRVDRAAVLLADVDELVDSGGRRYSMALLLQMRGLVDELRAVLGAASS
jgi:hypothetical protein